MKYWNKSKKYREQSWFNVKIIDNDSPVGLYYYQRQILKNHKASTFAEHKYWCQQQSSTGRFYYSPYTGWWFENEQDALLFSLRWS